MLRFDYIKTSSVFLRHFGNQVFEEDSKDDCIFRFQPSHQNLWSCYLRIRSAYAKATRKAAKISLEQIFFLATGQSILLILRKLMKSFHSTCFIVAVFDMIMFSLTAQLHHSICKPHTTHPWKIFGNDLKLSQANVPKTAALKLPVFSNFPEIYSTCQVVLAITMVSVVSPTLRVKKANRFPLFFL